MNIRHAKSSDAQTILDFIHLLADFEKEPDAVKTTVKDILRDGFGDKPYFKCLIAENEKNEAFGIALYFFTWSTWKGRPTLYLEDLFVKPEARGLKVGLKLFKELSKIALENKCLRLDFSVLDWNTPAIDFYEKLGASNMKEWFSYRMEADALITTANINF